MNDDQFERLTRLLQEGHALQRESLALQKDLMAQTTARLEETRQQLERATRIQDQAEALQRSGRHLLNWLLPVLLVLGILLIWLT